MTEFNDFRETCINLQNVSQKFYSFLLEFIPIFINWIVEQIQYSSFQNQNQNQHQQMIEHQKLMIKQPLFFHKDKIIYILVNYCFRHPELSSDCAQIDNANSNFFSSGFQLMSLQGSENTRKKPQKVNRSFDSFGPFYRWITNRKKLTPNITYNLPDTTSVFHCFQPQSNNSIPNEKLSKVSSFYYALTLTLYPSASFDQATNWINRTISPHVEEFIKWYKYVTLDDEKTPIQNRFPSPKGKSYSLTIFLSAVFLKQSIVITDIASSKLYVVAGTYSCSMFDNSKQREKDWIYLAYHSRKDEWYVIK